MSGRPPLSREVLERQVEALLGVPRPGRQSIRDRSEQVGRSAIAGLTAAYHESGHALVGSLLGLRSAGMTVDGAGHGTTRFRSRPDCWGPTDELAVTVAGHLAEVRWGRGYANGSDDDEQAAADLVARDAAADLAVGYVEDVLDHWGYKSIVDELADQLVRHRSLTGEQVDDILDNACRCWVPRTVQGRERRPTHLDPDLEERYLGGEQITPDDVAAWWRTFSAGLADDDPTWSPEARRVAYLMYQAGDRADWPAFRHYQSLLIDVRKPRMGA